MNQPAPLKPDEKSQIPKVAHLLEQQKKQIQAALPRHLTPERMARIALTEVRKNPELAMCEPLSFLGAIIQCAQLGLEPGNALGHVYLIPFWNSKKGVKEVQVIPGYRGLIDLARRSGQIISISARTVHEFDDFEYEYGLDEKLTHKPNPSERGDMIGAYAVAKLKDGGMQFEYMSRREIDKIKKDGNPVWKNHYEEMARKTLVRRLFKYLPVSIEIANLIELSDREETGLGQDNDQILIDVGVEHVEEPTDTVKAANEDLTKKGKEETTKKLIAEVNAAVKKKLAEGVSLNDIEKEIGPLADIYKLKADQLHAALDILNG